VTQLLLCAMHLNPSSLGCWGGGNFPLKGSRALHSGRCGGKPGTQQEVCCAPDALCANEW
jgi:hypothetical protein